MPPQPRLNVEHLEEYHISRQVVDSTVPESDLHKHHKDKLDFLKQKFPKIGEVYRAFGGEENGKS